MEIFFSYKTQLKKFIRLSLGNLMHSLTAFSSNSIHIYIGRHTTQFFIEIFLYSFFTFFILILRILKIISANEFFINFLSLLHSKTHVYHQTNFSYNTLHSFLYWEVDLIFIETLIYNIFLFLFLFLFLLHRLK